MKKMIKTCDNCGNHRHGCIENGVCGLWWDDKTMVTNNIAKRIAKVKNIDYVKAIKDTIAVKKCKGIKAKIWKAIEQHQGIPTNDELIDIILKVIRREMEGIKDDLSKADRWNRWNEQVTNEFLGRIK